MTTPIRRRAIDLAKGSFQVCAIGQDEACVDARATVALCNGGIVPRLLLTGQFTKSVCASVKR
jgi:hypothetical protein